MSEPAKRDVRRWARSSQRANQDAPAPMRGLHRLGSAEPGSREVVTKIPEDLGERITEAAMAQGYRESAEEDQRLAEADMAAGFETLPAS